MMIHLLRSKGLDEDVTADVPEDSNNDVQKDASTTDVLVEEYATDGPVENFTSKYKSEAVYCYW